MKLTDKIIGQRIHRLRDSAGLTQAQLAERLHVQPETISRYEAGKLAAPVDRLVRIADVLGLRIEDLVRTPSRDVAHDHAVDRLLLFAALHTAEEIELLLDVGGPAVKFAKAARAH